MLLVDNIKSLSLPLFLVIIQNNILKMDGLKSVIAQFLQFQDQNGTP